MPFSPSNKCKSGKKPHNNKKMENFSFERRPFPLNKNLLHATVQQLYHCTLFCNLISELKIKKSICSTKNTTTFSSFKTFSLTDNVSVSRCSVCEQQSIRWDKHESDSDYLPGSRASPHRIWSWWWYITWENSNCHW